MALTVAAVDACAVPRWAPLFAKHTLPFALRQLTDEEVAYLHSDGVVLPGPASAGARLRGNDDADSDSGSSDEASDQENDGHGDDGDDDEDRPATVSLPELEAWLTMTIEDLGGDVLPKLNWSTPKDAVWMSPTNSLRCSSVDDVLLLLKSSDHIAHDLSHASEDLTVARRSG